MANSQDETLLEGTDAPANEIPQTVRPRLTLYAKLVINGWLLEFLSLAIGIAAIVALCAELRHYNGKEAPTANAVVGVKITLNTLVAILSTIGRVALLLPVTEAISQSKWTWYSNNHRPLEDLAVFDKASRGPWGGLQLLWKINVRQIASLGAILVIGGLAVDPLSQQLVHYRTRNVPGSIGSATIPSTIEWYSGGQDTNTLVRTNPDLTLEPPLPMKGAIQNGLYSQLSDILDLEPACSTGNCTWPSYRSLAVCARSADVSSSLTPSSVRVPGDSSRGTPSYKGVKWSLTPHNHVIASDALVINVSSGAKQDPILSTDSSRGSSTGDPIRLDFSDSIAFKDSTAPIADVFIIYSTSRTIDEDHPAEFSAVEFVLEWCVQNFTTTVVNGNSSTVRHDASSNLSMPDMLAFPQAEPDDGDNRRYLLEPFPHYTLQQYFQSLFQGSVNTTMGDSEARIIATNDATLALLNPFDRFGRRINGTDEVAGRGVGLDGLQKILDNTATAMTNLIRNNDNRNPGDSDESFAQIQGTADSIKTYVEVQWGWIAAPIALLVGTVIFFVATILSSSSLLRHQQQPKVWKSSILPLLKGLDAESQGFTGMRTTSEMEDWARDVPVRLTREGDGDGWKLKRMQNGEEKRESLEMEAWDER